MDPIYFALVGMVGALVSTGTMLLIAHNRTGTVAAVGMTKRRMVLVSQAPPQALYGWLTQYSPDGYKIEDVDPSTGRFVLSSRPTLFSWGFFFPGVVYADQYGSRLELGITSRAVQWGPVVTKAHRKLAHELAAMTNSRVIEN
ncbi:hypothetical protein BJF85_11010 [Saccharomonospora sp. CUA-673]|uniref:hypothetical protein n=1 Tax=Saccharomonospora sp. CUA-673 TaxID=1904969 RepID=UPI0009624B3F|nr:hypothetical protein [Saccharomonospora sp. CUA-673]OLT48971.1 hypothetical protein BJF85_11010 [Saccharomonospora sp. CUA-673]